MQFDGTFTIEDATIDEVWETLLDPANVRNALPGCEFLVEVDADDPDFDALREEAASRSADSTGDGNGDRTREFVEGGRYAAVVEVSVGSVSPEFETVITIEEREKPRMTATGEGTSSGSSFEMDSGMELSENDDGGVDVEWWSEAEVFGQIAQMGQRVMNPVANRVVQSFFDDIESQL